MIGQSLLHYEMTEKLGEGGMGVVYKARDTHLDRFVAIKVLPPERTADPTRKARFVQEAKAASALNHPNIVTIHDISQDGGVDFIAMEHVEGRTLDQLIPRHGMRLNEALKIAIQIADALARAHAAGIIHRDLKPANIMVDNHGHVKVLDFGLAKLTEVSSDDRTVTMKTEEGAIVGTAAYMSPEQAEGRPVDARSDIFSFGAVLYEMISGRRPFQGDSNMSILAAILQANPPELGEEAPHDLRKAVARCLHKSPSRRFQHMDDLKVALEELAEDSASGKLAAVPEAPKARRPWWPAAAAGLVLVGLGAIWLLRQRDSGDSAAPRVTSLTFFAGRERQPALSPDGKQIAFVWDGAQGNSDDIYVMLVGATTPLRITTDPAEEASPVWSPDGTQLAFVRISGDRASIFMTSALGGPERKLVDFAPVPQPPVPISPALSWSPSGEWLAFSETDPDGGNGLTVISVKNGGKKRLVSNPLTSLRHHYPAFSPDGQALAYAGCTGERSCEVYVQELGGGFRPEGAPRRMTGQGGTILGIAWAADGKSLIYSCSPDLGSPFALWRVNLSDGEAPTPLSWTRESATHPTTAKSGNRLAFSSIHRLEYVLRKLQPGSATEVFLADGGDPGFSPDGKRLGFASNRAGRGSELWVANADGSNQLRLIEGTERMLGAVHWSPDSRWIVYNAQQEDGHWDNCRIDASGGQPQNLTAHPADDTLPSYSRDGKWIYFASNRTGRFEVWRMPSEKGPASQITRDGGFEAQESPDGQTLFYTKGWYSPLYAQTVSGGPERLILESAKLAVHSFVVVENGVYFVWRPDDLRSKPCELRFFDLRTGKDQTLTAFEAGGQQGLTVSPDRKTILFGTVGRSNYDILLVDDFR